MAVEWKSISVGEAPVEIIDGDRGANYPKQDDFAASGYCLFLNTGNVTKTGFSFSEQSFITKAKDAALRKGKLQRHDVVLTTRGTVGNVALFGDSVPFEHVRINSGMVLLRADRAKLLPTFLYQFVRSPVFKEQVAGLSTGSAQPQLPIRDIRRIKIPLPPLPEQKAIAAVLGALDDKIELNRRMNATLEAIARALFQSWFVDFDPVCAKQEGRAPAGLDEPTAALFPAQFQDSALGPIPQGWEVDTIKNRASNIQYGFTQSATDQPVGPRFLRITDIRGGSINWEAVPFCEITNAEQQKYKILDGDIFIARTGTSTGDNIYVVEPPLAVFASYLIRIQFASRGAGRLVGEFTRTSDYAAHVAGTLGGSAQPNASAQALTAASLVFPTDDLAEAFYKAIRPLDLKRAANDCESRTLATLRDTLLPKLLSGELSVRRARETLENAA